MNNGRAQKLPYAESLSIDRDHYYRQILHGYYVFECVVTTKKIRTAKFYIPEGTVYNQPTIFVMVPEGTGTYDFLIQSGWKQMADVKKQHIVLMEAEDGKWGQDEDEIAYINALREDVSYRPFFSGFSPGFYGIAYGNTARILAKQIRWNPKAWAGVALIGPCGISKEEKERLESTETSVPGITYSQVQMPVWLAVPKGAEESQRLLEYYERANHGGQKVVEDEGKRVIIHPREGGDIDEHWCADIVYEERSWEECLGVEYGEKIWETLWKGVYRYPGTLNGALRKNKSIEERGFEKYSQKVAGGYREDKSDYYTREWWVYVPQSADRREPIPAVFVFHGAGGSGDEIADRSGWAFVAEKYGFLIICPGASIPNRVRKVSNMVTNEMFRSMWNTGKAEEERPSDILFVDYLYQWLIDHYPVDESRIYASGQSSGGTMCWACASYRPDYFAAVAPVSAKTRNIESAFSEEFVKGSVIPVMCCMGLKDKVFPGGFETEDAKELISHWQSAFGLTKGWDSYSYGDGGKNCSSQNGAFINYLYETSGGVPILRCVEVPEKAHAIWPSECEMIWREWFSKFSKDPDTKELYYRGHKV